jgi:hypothetical protein
MEMNRQDADAQRDLKEMLCACSGTSMALDAGPNKY